MRIIGVVFVAYLVVAVSVGFAVAVAGIAALTALFGRGAVAASWLTYSLYAVGIALALGLTVVAVRRWPFLRLPHVRQISGISSWVVGGLFVLLWGIAFVGTKMLVGGWAVFASAYLLVAAALGLEAAIRAGEQSHTENRPAPDQ